MAANKGKGTKLEIMFGKFLWNAGTRTVANSLPLFLRYSAKSLFFKRLYQTIENIKYSSFSSFCLIMGDWQPRYGL